MELKVYRTNNPRFPWTAEDNEGHSVKARTKDAAINTFRLIYKIVPKISEDQRVPITNEVKLNE